MRFPGCNESDTQLSITEAVVLVKYIIPFVCATRWVCLRQMRVALRFAHEVFGFIRPKCVCSGSFCRSASRTEPFPASRGVGGAGGAGVVHGLFIPESAKKRKQIPQDRGAVAECSPTP